MEKRKDVSSKYNMFLKHFEMSDLFYTTIKKCKSWHKQRQWLLANGIDYSTFEEEAEF